MALLEKLMLAVILPSFFMGCHSETGNLYEFNPVSISENTISLSEIADDVYYIPLDNYYPMGLIYDNIEFINGAIYLSVKDVGVLYFNRDGKLVKKIGAAGRGPGEYLYCYSFVVDNKSETIYVNNRPGLKVYSKDGKFLKELSLKEYGYISEIKTFNSNLYAFYEIQDEGCNYKWILVDSSGIISHKQRITTAPFKSGVGGGVGICMNNNKLTYWNGNFDDTIFSILPDLSEKPFLKVSSGEFRLPKNKIIYPNEVDKFFSIANLIETNNFIMIRYFCNEKKYFAIIDKRTTEKYTTYWDFDGSGGIVNDIDCGIDFLPVVYFTENDREFLVAKINPYQIIHHQQSSRFKDMFTIYPEKKRKFEDLANSLKETDNPVLMIVRLNK